MTNATDAQPSNTDITDHFSSWGGHHTLRDGFVDWAWDMRPEILAALHGGVGVGQLLDDIAYSLQQCEEFRTAEQEELERAAQGFLEHHRDELIEALEDVTGNQ